VLITDSPLDDVSRVLGEPTLAMLRRRSLNRGYSHSALPARLLAALGGRGTVNEGVIQGEGEHDAPAPDYGSLCIETGNGPNGAESYVIRVVATGNYSNEAQPDADKTTVVVAMKPTTLNTIIGTDATAPVPFTFEVLSWAGVVDFPIASLPTRGISEPPHQTPTSKLKDPG
jgi:hypothetical protein